jgi:hypothetical protein
MVGSGEGEGGKREERKKGRKKRKKIPISFCHLVQLLSITLTWKYL